MNGRDDTTTFLPLDSRIGGQNRDSPTVGQYLTRDQMRYIYKKVETGEIINMDTILLYNVMLPTRLFQDQI